MLRARQHRRNFLLNGGSEDRHALRDVASMKLCSTLTSILSTLRPVAIPTLRMKVRIETSYTQRIQRVPKKSSVSFARFSAPDALTRFGCISPQSATRL